MAALPVDGALRNSVVIWNFLALHMSGAMFFFVRGSEFRVVDERRCVLTLGLVAQSVLVARGVHCARGGTSLTLLEGLAELRLIRCRLPLRARAVVYCGVGWLTQFIDVL